MELNRAESAAVAAVGGVPADVLDLAGRLVVTPHALTIDGQRNVPADLQPGESLAAFLERHVPGIGSGAWTVMIGGAVVPQAMWARTFPKHGQLIACRAVLRRSALQLVALAALTYFSGGIAAGIYGAAGGTYVAAAAGTWISAIQAGVFIAGSVLINKVLGPKIPSAQSLAQKQIYSLSDQRNTARPYEPIPVLWGEMRVTPDLASKAYAWYEGDDQYLSTILLGGINVHSAADLAIGDTPIGNYSDVSVYYNGFSGMTSQNVPLYSNVDAVAGAEFVNGGDWITRTGSAGAGVLQLDIEGQLYDVGGKGNINSNWVDLTIQARLVGAPAWTTLSSSTLTNASTDVLRRTFSFDVAPGQYEVRAKLGLPRWNDGGSGDACKFTWVSLKSVQADTTDYSQWGRIGIKIRASGQLSGSLDQVRATYRAKPMPIWTGTGWATATTRADGLSNPGAILLQTLRGIWTVNPQGQRVLQFGFGLSDEQIDIEGLKAFILHCAARGYTYDKWITPSMSLGAFCEEVALAGMGEFAWTDGSRPTAVFVTNGQPNSAVVNMANMLKGGFSVDYALSNAADGIEYQWLNRDTWEMTTLRVMAPGVTTMLSPARVTGEGITSEAHAAVMARYHLAQSLYQYKTVHYTADIEHLDYRRLSVLSVSHDLTQWGFGGRVMAAKRIGAQVQLTLDEPVPALASAYIGLRVPGARDYRVWPVQPLVAESDVVTLVGEWPADLDFPGEGIGNPAHDTLWCYDFKATPGYRVRVTGIDPESDLKGARITAVPEGPEFWDYVLNGTYVPAPNQSSIPQLGRPVVKNLRVAEKVNLQGDTEWYELSCVWDVEGDCDHAQVWAGRDGSELRMVDGNAQGARSTFRIDGAGEWLIVVRPFNANGKAGQSATLLYITTMTQLPPRNPGTFVVQQVEGGLRRFAWMYAGERPAAFAGVQIRYLPGDVPLSVANWDAMQPLGAADDVYSAQFETTKPGAGQWTFGLRAVDTAGQLATGVMRFVAVLDKVFENIREPDLTPPPAPTGVTAVPLMTTAQVNWASPTYTVGHGHDHSVIYASLWATGGTAPAFSAAKSVGTEQGHPASIPVELGSKYTIWVTHVSVDGVESAPSAGVTFVTAQDVGKLLDVLEGKITESQLYTDLAKEIDLISGTGAGSVNARVQAEAQARAQAVAAEASTRAQAVASEAAARGQDVAAMAADLQAATDDLQARIDAVNAQVSDIIGASDFDLAQAYEAGQLVKYQNKLYRAKVNTVGNLPTNTTYWDLVGDYASLGEAVAAHAAQLADHANRITQTEQGLTAEATARTTLAAQLRGNYTGSDAAQVTSGLVWSERQARVSGDSANASAIDAVKARLPTGTGKVASEASVTDEAAARAAADAAAASRTTVIEGRLPAGNGQLATAAAVTALDTRVTSAEGSITSQSGQITNLQNNLAAAGGPNLIYNSSFELLASNGAIDGWALGGVGTGTVSRVASWLAAKEYAARVDAPGLAAGQYKDFNPIAALYPVVDAAGSYMLSVFVRAGAGVKVRIYGQSLDAAGATLQTFTGAQLIPGEGMRATLQMGPMHANTTTLRVIQRVYDLSGAAVWVEWDRVQVEAGMVATAWRDNSQARDAATSSALSGLTSRVTAAEGNITSTSGQVTSLSNSVSAVDQLLTITDTRNTDQPPSWYWANYKRRTVRELKTRTVIGAPGTSAMGYLETTVRWNDSTGGPIVQVFSTDDELNQYSRYSTVNDGWTVWKNAVRDLQTAVNLKADASALSSLDTRVTAAEGNISSTSAQVTSLSNTLTTTTGTANAAQAAAQAASDLAGGKGKVIYSATAPAVADRQTQNLWIDTTGGANTPKRWTGSAWAAVTDKVATDAAAAAAAAQATANTKADASALSALDSKVTTQGNTLTSQGSAITALQNSITNGPVLPSDFSAGLGNWTLARQGDPSTVASATGTIVTNDADFGVCAQFNNWTVAGQNVLTKGLVQAIPGRVYRVRARFKVAAAGGFPLGLNLVAGGNTATYSSGGDAFSSPVSITAAGQIAEITALFSDKAANAAGAIAWGATAVLLRFGLRINGNIATGLQLRVQSITVEDATADAANADATTALTSRVTTAEGNITSTSGALTTLTNRVTAAEGVNTSQATAISGLQSSVTSINGTLTSQGNSITSLSNSLDALQGAGDNLLKASNVELVRAAESYQMGGYTTTETLILGETYTLVACITHTPASGDVTSSVGAWVNGLKTINQNLVRNGSKVIATATFVFDHATAAGTLVNFYYYPSTIKTGAATVHWACLYQGAVVPPKAWQPSLAELGQALQTKADASALSSLQSTVSQQGDTITSQGSSLAALKNTVENPTTGLGSKASSSALTALDSKVTGIDGRLTSETSRIDSLQVSVSEAGGQNLLYNPSFDIGAATGIAGLADGYSRGGSAGVVATPSLPASWLDPLGKAQRYDCTGLTASLYADLFTANNLKPAVVEGQRAALSVYVRASAGLTVRVYLQAKADQTIGASLATYTGTLVTPGESGARLTLLTPALPAGTTALHVIFRFYGTATVNAGWVEWDRAQMELGTTVTAWRDNGVAGLNTVNAAVNTLAAASANADAALASRATALESRMPTGTGQLATAAALTAVDTKVTNIDGRVTSESSRLDQVQAAVGSAAAVLQALNPLGGESEWSAVGGAAAATFVTAAEPDARGGAVLTVGNATVSGERWLRHVATIPMDENKLYKLSARFRRTSGDGGIYLGIAGLNAAKSLYVTTNNTESSSISSAHYATNNAKPALGTWQVVEYYFKGRAAGAATGSGTKASPGVFANKVAHLALMIVGNYQGQVGFFDLDYITLEDVTADEQALAAIATEATTRATTDGYLGAQYSVRMQLSQGGQQVVGGFGISGTTSGTAGPQIDFGVMANSFWIAAPSGSPGGVSNVKPFVVQTTAQTVNGVSVPAGVYMDAVYINNVTALWARFGNLVADTIQATSISVTKLTGGNLSVGSWINSSNYVTGSTGWSINENGKAEFSDVTVRGTIYSSAGTIGGITINGNGLNSGGFWGYVWPPAGQSGFHIGPNGILLGNANNGRYVEIQSNGNIFMPGFNVQNGNATFFGNLSGASGTFSGTLTAQRVISMENLDYNIATVAVGVTAGDQVSPINGEILGVTAPAADWSATYIVSFHAAVGAGSRGVLQIQVDGGTQFEFSLSEGGMKSFSFTFSGKGVSEFLCKR
ncbi:host specificity factor TipJ family phage tail protein, partial [Comamonas thiooxydans]